MNKVALEGLEFFGYHGVSGAERQTGNRYGVDIVAETDFGTAATEDNLSDTVDYVQLYGIIRDEVAIPSKLLENVAHRICEKVLTNFPKVKNIEITVRKYNPPLGGICYCASITYKKERL